MRDSWSRSVAGACSVAAAGVRDRGGRWRRVPRRRQRSRWTWRCGSGSCSGQRCTRCSTSVPPGVRDDRPGLDNCLRALRKGDVLVVWKLDRLGRNLAHLPGQHRAGPVRPQCRPAGARRPGCADRRPGRPAERLRGGGDARAHGARGFAGLHHGRPAVAEVGLRKDGGDAETGAGMDVGGGARLHGCGHRAVAGPAGVVHQAEGFSERGMSLSDGTRRRRARWGLSARVAPSWERTGAGRGRGAVGQPDGLRHGLAPSVWVRRPGRRGGGATGCRWAPASWGRRAAG